MSQRPDGWRPDEAPSLRVTSPLPSSGLLTYSRATHQTPRNMSGGLPVPASGSCPPSCPFLPQVSFHQARSALGPCLPSEPPSCLCAAPELCSTTACRNCSWHFLPRTQAYRAQVPRKPSPARSWGRPAHGTEDPINHCGENQVQEGRDPHGGRPPLPDSRFSCLLPPLCPPTPSPHPKLAVLGLVMHTPGVDPLKAGAGARLAQTLESGLSPQGVMRRELG